MPRPYFLPPPSTAARLKSKWRRRGGGRPIRREGAKERAEKEEGKETNK